MRIEVRLGGRYLRRSQYLALAARHILNGVVAANMLWIRARAKAGMRTPLPYDAGVRYRPEPDNGVEEFADIPTIWERGWGDCDDLAPWVCAWRRVQGEDCHLRITWRRSKTGRKVFHVVVRRADGSVEDPSRILGMGRRRRRFQIPLTRPRRLTIGSEWPW